MRKNFLLIGVSVIGLFLGSTTVADSRSSGAGIVAGDLKLLNTGYAVDNLAVATHLVAFQVNEAQQGGASLNSDSDVDDKVIHVMDTTTGVIRNLGLAGGSPFVEGALVSFAVPEEDQGYTDLNGDGDRADTVWHVYDARTGVTSNLGVAISQWSLQIGDPLVLATASEEQQGASDLNGDGDATDWVAHVYHADSGTMTNLALAVDVGTSYHFDAREGIAAFFVDEADHGANDQNNDGDAFDLVLHVYEGATKVLTNTQLASSEVAIEDARAIVRVSEFGQGNTDLNGDGDAIDSVLFVHEVATGAQTNIGYECASSTYNSTHSFAAEGNLIAFRFSENGQGVDGNGDGDLEDAVYAVYDVGAATLTNTGFAGPQYSLAIDDGYVAFLVVEWQQGDTDLNGDGDSDDWVLHLYDHGLKATTNLSSASSTYSHDIDGGKVAVEVHEEDEGGDLNGDADVEDAVLFLHDVAGGGPTNLGLASGGSSWVLGMSDVMLAFRVREQYQGSTDLNGDGDDQDFVGHLLDLSSGITTNLGLATQPISVVGATAAFKVYESQQGSTDLNGDGDATDAVLYVTQETLFADGFESGDCSRWAQEFPLP